MRWLVLVLIAGCVHGAVVPAVPGMGKVHWAIDTRSPEAQRHFDNGLAAAWGFNYDEAVYEFNVAIHADRECAMCNWGMAYAFGPNINEVMKQYPGAYDTAKRAASLAKTPVEQALTKALLARFAPNPMYTTDDRSKMDDAYLAAMRDAAKLAPDNPDVQTLLAEALWMATPLGLPGWEPDRTTKYPHVTEAVQLLEKIVARWPDHIGAIHFYIHASDGSPYMEKSVQAAVRLATLAPQSGHLLHMPSHLTLKLGRYADAIAENRAAIAADKHYVDSWGHGTSYEGFTMHPRSYLLYVLTLVGASKEAKELAASLRDDMLKMGPMMMGPQAGEMGNNLVATTAARFGDWDTILAIPAPTAPGPTIGIEFARGLALVAKGKLDEATAELEKIRKGPDMDQGPPPGAPPAPPPGDHDEHHDEPPPGMGLPPLFQKQQHEQLVAAAAAVAAHLEGAIAEARKDHAKAIELLRNVVELEIVFTNKGGELGRPLISARQRLGAVLLAAGQPAEAEAVYRKDLEVIPENGWSLFGLAQALDAQHKPEAAAVRARFEAAWKLADIKLTSSVF
jgi:tetratricopeptide (TPR) repeat protein